MFKKYWTCSKKFECHKNNFFTKFKCFWACSKLFKHSQIFWSLSKARFYIINLHICALSKIFEHIQNYWTRSKIFEHGQKIFELADGLGIKGFQSLKFRGKTQLILLIQLKQIGLYCFRHLQLRNLDKIRLFFNAWGIWISEHFKPFSSCFFLK